VNLVTQLAPRVRAVWANNYRNPESLLAAILQAQLVTLPSPPRTEPRPRDASAFDAQHAQRIRGIPGSDTPVASGIQSTDPMNQGVGAVMRSTQRLFGITDRHCIDVEVWQSLSPDELTARHLSPADVRREGDKYNCNRPLGLNFQAACSGLLRPAQATSVIASTIGIQVTGPSPI
jgi:hypothetical protein